MGEWGEEVECDRKLTQAKSGDAFYTAKRGRCADLPYMVGEGGGAGFWDLFPNRGALSRRDFEWGYLFLLPLLLHPQSDTRCERHVVRGERYAPASLPYPLLLPPGAGLGLKVGTHKMMVTISGL